MPFGTSQLTEPSIGDAQVIVHLCQATHVQETRSCLNRVLIGLDGLMPFVLRNTDRSDTSIYAYEDSIWRRHERLGQPQGPGGGRQRRRVFEQMLRRRLPVQAFDEHPGIVGLRKDLSSVGQQR